MWYYNVYFIYFIKQTKYTVTTLQLHYAVYYIYFIKQTKDTITTLSNIDSNRLIHFIIYLIQFCLCHAN